MTDSISFEQITNNLQNILASKYKLELVNKSHCEAHFKKSDKVIIVFYHLHSGIQILLGNNNLPRIDFKTLGSFLFQKLDIQTATSTRASYFIPIEDRTNDNLTNSAVKQIDLLIHYTPDFLT